MRAAIGAGRGRLVRQLLTEGLVLAAARRRGRRAARVRGPAGRSTGVGTDVLPVPVQLRFLTSTAPCSRSRPRASLATAVLFGLVPALSASKPELVPALKGRDRRGAEPAPAARCGDVARGRAARAVAGAARRGRAARPRPARRARAPTSASIPSPCLVARRSTCR